MATRTLAFWRQRRRAWLKEPRSSRRAAGSCSERGVSLASRGRAMRQREPDIELQSQDRDAQERGPVRSNLAARAMESPPERRSWAPGRQERALLRRGDTAGTVGSAHAGPRDACGGRAWARAVVGAGHRGQRIRRDVAEWSEVPRGARRKRPRRPPHDQDGEGRGADVPVDRHRLERGDGAGRQFRSAGTCRAHRRASDAAARAACAWSRTWEPAAFDGWAWCLRSWAGSC